MKALFSVDLGMVKGGAHCEQARRK